MNRIRFVLASVLLVAQLLPHVGMAEDKVAQSPVELWQDFDPDNGDFKEEIVAEATQNGIDYRDSYISAYVLGEEIRVYCKYAVKAGATSAPGLLNVHGWMQTANIDPGYVTNGWAEMSFDYCGKKEGRAHFTKYPEKMDYGRMEGKVIHSKLPDGKDITDPKQTSHYLWFAIQRRVLSYLCAQKEVGKSRIGAMGYSYGGTLMWNLGMDPRVKAIVAFFGIGWIEYYRNHSVWMYNVPYQEPPMTPGEKLFLATVEAQSHAPYITAATLWLNGSNDHHGGHERSETTFKMLKEGVPRSFAIQAGGRHNTEQLGDDCRLWLEKHVLGKDVAWPDRPRSEIALGQDGVPELRVTPASTEQITEVQIYECQKTPNNFDRAWHRCPGGAQRKHVGRKAAGDQCGRLCLRLCECPLREQHRHLLRFQRCHPIEARQARWRIDRTTHKGSGKLSCAGSTCWTGMRDKILQLASIPMARHGHGRSPTKCQANHQDSGFLTEAPRHGDV